MMEMRESQAHSHTHTHKIGRKQDGGKKKDEGEEFFSEDKTSLLYLRCGTLG